MGPEAIAEVCRQSFHGLNYFTHATVPRILQWATPKRRESGAEYSPRIEQVGIAYDTFVEAGNRFIKHWQYQAVADIWRQA
jgi:hypothetical protein